MMATRLPRSRCSSGSASRPSEFCVSSGISTFFTPRRRSACAVVSPIAQTSVVRAKRSLASAKAYFTAAGLTKTTTSLARAASSAALVAFASSTFRSVVPGRLSGVPPSWRTRRLIGSALPAGRVTTTVAPASGLCLSISVHRAASYSLMA